MGRSLPVQACDAGTTSTFQYDVDRKLPGVILNIWARKPIEDLCSEAAVGSEVVAARPRSIGFFALTCFGVGSTVGAGIFVLTGTVAAEHAGPAVALSFVLASLVCLLAGLCYAELASMIPVAGSAY